MSNILYRPDLSYKKNYYTDGIFENENTSSDTLQDINVKDDLNELINKIQSNFEIIPSKAIDVFLPPFVGIVSAVKEISDDMYKNIYDKKTDDIIVKDISNDDEVIDIPSDPFKTTDDVYIDMQTQVISIDEELTIEYYKDLLDIARDYFLNLDNSLEKYLYNLLFSISQTDQKINLDNIKTHELENKDLQHLSDYIIKSEIILEQQTRLYKKFFDIDETILHLRSCKISNLQRIRYLKEDYMNGNKNLEINSNKILKESRLVAQKKYEENFYNLFKYLNSSVILLNEYTNMIVKQNESKILINEKERINK